MPIRVLVAEDNVLLRDGITRLIDASDDLELAGECGNYDELLGLAEEAKPDVVLTDIRMPPTGTDEGIRAAAALRVTQPMVGVVVLSQFASPSYALALLEGGSEGRAYLLKDRIADVDDLLDAVRTVAAGGSVIDPKVVEELVAARSKGKSPLDHLTPRERSDPGRDGHGQEQRRDRRGAGALRAGRREAHQLDLLQAAPRRGARREPPGEGGAALPRSRGWLAPPGSGVAARFRRAARERTMRASTRRPR